MLFFFLSMASAQITNTTGFVPAHAACVTLKNTLCTDALCLTADVAIGGEVLNYLTLTTGAPVPMLPPGMDGQTAILWAQMAYVTTNVVSAMFNAPMDQIHPSLNAVYECEARESGLIWANYLGVWSATQTCRAVPACVTAWTNIRTNSIAGENELGTVQDDGAEWMYIEAIDWYVPQPTNTDKQFCNMAFSAMEEKNALSSYLLSSMTALWFTPEQQASILDTCDQDMEDFIVGIVTTHVVKSIIIFSFVGLAIGSFFTGVGCWCCNRKSKAVNGV